MALLPILLSAIAQDFNGDGYHDLAIGIPGEDVGTIANAGAVQVIYGAFGGLRSSGNQFLHQSTFGIFDVAEAGDNFGQALAWGDFDADGYDDLAIGVPYEDFGLRSDAGAVQIIYGSSAGLSTRNSIHNLDNAGMAGVAANSDLFGAALCSGDFNGDGYADLAIGIPYANYGSVQDCGAVSVIYGGNGGFGVPIGDYWQQGLGGIPDKSDTYDLFGATLACGDFTNDGRDDLAIGAPWEDVGLIESAGAVTIMLGDAGGLIPTPFYWTQDTFGVQDQCEAGEAFGYALASADFDGNGYDDIAVGVPWEDIGFATDAGAVAVFFSGLAGPGGSFNQFWSQDSLGILDVSETSDAFGFSLAAAQLGGTAHADLAIGVPFEKVGSVVAAGAVNVIFGAAGTLTEAGDQFWSQDTFNVLDACERNDMFGYRLTAGDFNRNALYDLAVGIPWEDVGAVLDAGAVAVLNGGLTSTGNQFWTQDSLGLLDLCESADVFSTGLMQ
ncbi:MAG: hypothetical protein EYC70_01765 [Planctomycetota bacterium]|nr:MAG: hypothetical protein EYC70_01765 [Planctomycetota bacterium]